MRASLGGPGNCGGGWMDPRRFPEGVVAPMLGVAALNVFYDVQEMFDVVVIGLQAVLLFSLYFAQFHGDVSSCASQMLSMAIVSTAFAYLLYSAYRAFRIWF